MVLVIQQSNVCRNMKLPVYLDKRGLMTVLRSRRKQGKVLTACMFRMVVWEMIIGQYRV